MKAKKKRRSNRVASDGGLGEFPPEPRRLFGGSLYHAVSIHRSICGKFPIFNNWLPQIGKEVTCKICLGKLLYVSGAEVAEGGRCCNTGSRSLTPRHCRDGLR